MFQYARRTDQASIEAGGISICEVTYSTAQRGGRSYQDNQVVEKQHVDKP